jgi:hypothetical protein
MDRPIFMYKALITGDTSIGRLYAVTNTFQIQLVSHLDYKRLNDFDFFLYLRLRTHRAHQLTR